MEIRIDREILEADGYNYEHTMNLFCENFKRAGFVEEVNEECHLIYRGTDSPKDFSYMGLVYKGLVKQQWFKNCVMKWILWNNAHSRDGSFVAEDCIETAVRRGIKGFTYGIK